jgi:hypothetical protein
MPTFAAGRHGDGGGGNNLRALRTPLYVLRTALLASLFPVLPAGAVVAQRAMVCTDGTMHEGSFEEMNVIMASRAYGACLITWAEPSSQIHAGSATRSQADGLDGITSSGCLGWRAHCDDGVERSGCNGAPPTDFASVATCTINAMPTFNVSWDLRADIPSLRRQKPRRTLPGDELNGSLRVGPAQFAGARSAPKSRPNFAV